MWSFLMATLMVADAEPSRLAVIRPAPAFALSDTAGKQVSRDSFDGRVLLVGFVFTTCSGTCPATTHRMAKIQEVWNKHAADRDRVQFVTITLDPERDTPGMLRDYMRLYDIDTSNWSFLTGPPDDVRRVLAAWGMWARPGENGQLDHPSRLFLVDRRRRIREIYSLELLRTPWVIDDLRLLVSEP
jgi:protein SCO1/2